METGRRIGVVWGIFLAGILTSCIGVSSEIEVRKDGSGTIELEYRIARFMESLGKLDGNERWLPLPVGRADFERTLARIEGLRMTAFSSRDDGRDIINTVKLEFSDLDALLRFLDASGRRAALFREGEGYRLSLGFGGVKNADPDLLELVSSVSGGYELRCYLTLPGEASLSFTDGEGRPRSGPPAGTAVSEGKRVGFSSPMTEILSSEEAVVMDIRWR
jgi:hypothetical protein